jgi:hypothetical protein
VADDALALRANSGDDYFAVFVAPGFFYKLKGSGLRKSLVPILGKDLGLGILEVGIFINVIEVDPAGRFIRFRVANYVSQLGLAQIIAMINGFVFLYIVAGAQPGDVISGNGLESGSIVLVDIVNNKSVTGGSDGRTDRLAVLAWLTEIFLYGVDNFLVVLLEFFGRSVRAHLLNRGGKLFKNLVIGLGSEINELFVVLDPTPMAILLEVPAVLKETDTAKNLPEHGLGSGALRLPGVIEILELLIHRSGSLNVFRVKSCAAGLECSGRFVGNQRFDNLIEKRNVYVVVIGIGTPVLPGVESLKVCAALIVKRGQIGKGSVGTSLDLLIKLLQLEVFGREFEIVSIFHGDSNVPQKREELFYCVLFVRT